MAGTRRRSRADAAPPRPPLSRATLAWRAAIVIVLVPLAIWSFTAAVVAFARFGNPELALRLDGDDPVALATNAYGILAADPSPRNADRIRALAQRSLTEQALNARALRVIGLSSDLESNADLARRQLLAAHGMTRRDANLEFWLIEDNVRRNRVAGALAHYDHALRTTPESWDVLFPILTSAAADPQLRAPIAKLVGGDAPWLTDFLAYAIENSENPAAIGAVVQRAGGFPKSALDPPLEARLLQRLAATGRGREAISYYLTRPGANRALLTTAAFSDLSIDPRGGPVAWQTFNTPDLSVDFEAAESGGGFRLVLSVSAGASDVVASKLLGLPAGTYALSSGRQQIEGQPQARLFWHLDCVVNGRTTELWRGAPIGGAGAQRFTIPTDCMAQRLSLVAAGGDSADDDVAVTSPSLARVGR